ncbi:methyltransferase family protein [Roseibium marinum]|uniref:Protein-S-isoprenylcysteine O-methyltransferase Ste14 n=1 Tax=Roseibium marinum TaxID=281252 RepID=A0A2S3UXG6_9HYPH|nr:isoprenylcysteine carboxylmethyltransferase family protein [Roseibium marinum]POF32374.1 protein-S-isoprenylcysteine O-methyltransferase Ste14 [Roseibium marinum]
MELKVPPAIVFLLAALLLWVGAWLMPHLSIAFPGRRLFAVLLVLAGLVPGIQAILAFRRRKTTTNPMAPDTASVLVTDGVYRFSRNPMYLGILALLLAVTLWLGTLTALIIVPGFVWYMTEFQIKPEEERLGERFGASYRDYLGRVRRWI